MINININIKRKQNHPATSLPKDTPYNIPPSIDPLLRFKAVLNHFEIYMHSKIIRLGE